MPTENPLKVAVLGPSGQCGSCVVDELLCRGHHVVGISRNPPKTWKESTSNHQSYEGIQVNLHDTAKLSHVFSFGFDAIVCAFAPPISDMSTAYENGVEGHGRVKAALLRSSHDGVFIVIGRYIVYFTFYLCAMILTMRNRRSGLATRHEQKTTGRPVRFRI